MLVKGYRWVLLFGCVWRRKNPRFLRKGIDWLSSQFHWGCGFQLKAEVSPELHTNYRVSCRSGFYPAPVCLCVFLNCIRPSNFPQRENKFQMYFDLCQSTLSLSALLWFFCFIEQLLKCHGVTLDGRWSGVIINTAFDVSLTDVMI